MFEVHRPSDLYFKIPGKNFPHPMESQANWRRNSNPDEVASRSAEGMQLRLHAPIGQAGQTNRRGQRRNTGCSHPLLFKLQGAGW